MRTSIKFDRAKQWGSALLLATSALFTGGAAAQVPLKIITTDQPGGGMDSLIRPVAERLGQNLGRPVIVENKPGGRGQIAAAALQQAPADGNTIFITVQAYFVVAPHVRKTQFDMQNDFVPITDLGRGSLVLVTHPSVPAKTMKELMEWLKVQPKGSVSFASYSAGTNSHFGGLLMNQVGGFDMMHIPYKASPDALKDLIPGNVKLMWDGVPTSAGFIKAGRLNAIAFMGSKRIPIFPDLPTVREAGYPEIENDGWLGIFAKKGTDAAVVAQLQAEFTKVLSTPQVRGFYNNFGLDTGGMPFADFQKLVRSDYDRWGAFVKRIGYKEED